MRWSQSSYFFSSPKMIKLYEKKTVRDNCSWFSFLKAIQQHSFFMNEITHIYAGNTTKALKSLFALHTRRLNNEFLLKLVNHQAYFFIAKTSPFDDLDWFNDRKGMKERRNIANKNKEERRREKFKIIGYAK